MGTALLTARNTNTGPWADEGSILHRFPFEAHSAFTHAHPRT